MGFDKLQQQLKSFFETEASRTPIGINKAQIKESALAAFSARKKTNTFLQLWRPNWIRSATFGAIILSLVPIIGIERSAGELQPSGLVEIVRDGEVFIATNKTPLKIGDQILVGNNSSAEIQMRKNLKTTVGNKTELRVTNPHSLFLVRGNLSGDFKKNSTIATDRGQITGQDASLHITVSDTGETYIQPQENNIHITTWDNQKATLAAGEELRLHTDSLLPQDLPKDLKLSSSQILAIQAKLLIARTKALNALEHRINNSQDLYQGELISADRTFRSVVQVLKSSRNLEIVRRENLDLISRADVVERVTSRTDRTQLIAETRAVEALLDIIENNPLPNIQLANTDSRIYNRYILLQRLFAPLAANSRAHGNLLQEQYVQAMAKQISDSNNPQDQLNALLISVPQSTAGKDFIQKVKTGLNF